MLEKYKEGQPVAYEIFKNSVKEKKSIHAYMIQTDNILFGKQLAVDFSKVLICPKQNFVDKGCQFKDCNICNRIDNDVFPELKIIKPEGLWIRKEQISELREKFSLKLLEGNKRIYIILEPEKLNVYAANSILKFLEEPVENVIAFFITTNIYNVLDTVVSRCQVIYLNKNKREQVFIEKDNIALLNINFLLLNDEYLKNKVNMEKTLEKIIGIVTFIKTYENVKEDVLLSLNELWNPYIQNQDDILLALEVIIFFYKDVLKYLMLEEIEFFEEYKSIIEEIKNKNNFIVLIKKIKKVLLLKEKIKYNLNMSMIVDKLVFSLKAVEKDD
ncbi:MAG: hypothetical protein ACOXZR_01170 [Bacilli bacterium]